MSGVVVLGGVRVGGERERWSRWSSLVWAGLASAGLAVIALGFGWRGSDLPAQMYRVELFRRYGLVLWDSQWFGGHPTFGYSVLSPVFALVGGPLLLGAFCGVASALLFDRVVHYGLAPASRIGSLWFAAGTVTNLVVGRVTFALGVAFALAAVYALQHRWVAVAIVCAVACPLASPLAGLFLAIGVAGWGIAQPHRRFIAAVIATAALAPIVVIAVLFPDGGTYPYEPHALAWDLAVCSVFVCLVPRRYATLRWAALVYGAAAIGAFLVSSPVGENMSRFGQYAAGPLLLCVLAPHRRVLLGIVAVPLVVWQWFPIIDPIANAPRDPSTHRAYYQPLLTFVASEAPSVGRVEVPATFRHWEAAYLAPQLSLARGWERQLDIAYNPIFYDGTLTAASYRDWLAGNGVQYVALPDARLDSSSQPEKALILGGLPYLKPLWHDAHWTVWTFSDYHGLVDGPAEVTDVQPDHFTLDVHAAGTLTIHIHASPHWAVTQGGCVAQSTDGWTHIHATTIGTLRVTQALRGTPCT